MADETPSSKQFRIDEIQAMLADADVALERITRHRTYLTDPTLQEAHRADCRDNDVVVTNLTLAAGQIESAKRQLALALKITNPPEPKRPSKPAEEPQETEPPQPDPETP